MPRTCEIQGRCKSQAPGATRHFDSTDWSLRYSQLGHSCLCNMSLVSQAQRSSPRGQQALQEHRLTITYFYQKNKHFQFFFLNCKILIFAQVVHPTPYLNTLSGGTTCFFFYCQGSLASFIY